LIIAHTTPRIDRADMAETCSIAAVCAVGLVSPDIVCAGGIAVLRVRTGTAHSIGFALIAVAIATTIGAIRANPAITRRSIGASLQVIAGTTPRTRRTFVTCTTSATSRTITRIHPNIATANIQIVTIYAPVLAIGATHALAIYTIGIVVVTAIIATCPSIFTAIEVAVTGVVIRATAIALVSTISTIVALAAMRLTTKGCAQLVWASFVRVVAVDIVISTTYCLMLGVHTSKMASLSAFAVTRIEATMQTSVGIFFPKYTIGATMFGYSIATTIGISRTLVAIAI
jgi:hypothetical protein